MYIYICICITFFALTLCYTSFFLSTLHGVYTCDCSCTCVIAPLILPSLLSVSCTSLSFSSPSLPLSLPPSLPPSLPTVSLKWQVHFEFITKRISSKKSSHSDKSPSSTNSSTTVCQLLNDSSMEQMTWDLPIVILPTLPSQTDERTGIHSFTL